ncbi:alpha-ketoglutarate-dependent dioxygenase alkB homolog 6 isoform X2 [Aplysia californica]|uniref:Alpha-ketoglutarate-dependent dioxygenase alkB homolog 6 isoform X2 n=1 Tax=Aplysia californica TaxID=6500 RepID=A0ABM0K106_APLCA|nr:alpha-ketoglutarate-dependent dioxygenase alkB homolog 6 isoform X2 [Aplysia californica]
MSSRRNVELQKFILKDAPSSVYYIPNFISADEEQFLLNKVYSAPKPKWTQLSHRKLQNWGGIPLQKGMVAEPLPTWLKTYADKIHELGVFEDRCPNHVLVNEYLAGQGIMPHEDGPVFYPTVSTISLGSHTLLDFYYHLTNTGNSAPSDSKDNPSCETSASEAVSSFKDRHFLSVLLEPRSLVLVCDEMYKVHLHGIDERTCDVITEKVANLDFISAKVGDQLERGTRVSLTIRNVPKVLKTSLFFNRK